MERRLFIKEEVNRDDSHLFNRRGTPHHQKACKISPTRQLLLKYDSKVSRDVIRIIAETQLRNINETSHIIASQKVPNLRDYVLNLRYELTLLRRSIKDFVVQQQHYPRTKPIFSLLRRYIAVEIEVFARSKTEETLKEVKQNIHELLEDFLLDYFYFLDENSRSHMIKIYQLRLITDSFAEYLFEKSYHDKLTRDLIEEVKFGKIVKKVFVNAQVVCIDAFWLNDELKDVTKVDNCDTDSEDESNGRNKEAIAWNNTRKRKGKDSPANLKSTKCKEEKRKQTSLPPVAIIEIKDDDSDEDSKDKIDKIEDLTGDEESPKSIDSSTTNSSDIHNEHYSNLSNLEAFKDPTITQNSASLLPKITSSNSEQQIPNVQNIIRKSSFQEKKNQDQESVSVSTYPSVRFDYNDSLKESTAQVSSSSVCDDVKNNYKQTNCESKETDTVASTSISPVDQVTSNLPISARLLDNNTQVISHVGADNDNVITTSSTVPDSSLENVAQQQSPKIIFATNKNEINTSRISTLTRENKTKPCNENTVTSNSGSSIFDGEETYAQHKLTQSYIDSVNISEDPVLTEINKIIDDSPRNLFLESDLLSSTIPDMEIKVPEVPSTGSFESSKNNTNIKDSIKPSEDKKDALENQNLDKNINPIVESAEISNDSGTVENLKVLYADHKTVGQKDRKLYENLSGNQLEENYPNVSKQKIIPATCDSAKEIVVKPKVSSEEKEQISNQNASVTSTLLNNVNTEPSENIVNSKEQTEEVGSELIITEHNKKTIALESTTSEIAEMLISETVPDSQNLQDTTKNLQGTLKHPSKMDPLEEYSKHVQEDSSKMQGEDLHKDSSKTQLDSSKTSQENPSLSLEEDSSKSVPDTFSEMPKEGCSKDLQQNSPKSLQEDLTTLQESFSVPLQQDYGSSQHNEDKSLQENSSKSFSAPQLQDSGISQHKDDKSLQENASKSFSVPLLQDSGRSQQNDDNILQENSSKSFSVPQLQDSGRTQHNDDKSLQENSSKSLSVPLLQDSGQSQQNEDNSLQENSSKSFSVPLLKDSGRSQHNDDKSLQENSSKNLVEFFSKNDQENSLNHQVYFIDTTQASEDSKKFSRKRKTSNEPMESNQILELTKKTTNLTSLESVTEANTEVIGNKFKEEEHQESKINKGSSEMVKNLSEIAKLIVKNTNALNNDVEKSNETVFESPVLSTKEIEADVVSMETDSKSSHIANLETSSVPTNISKTGIILSKQETNEVVHLAQAEDQSSQRKSTVIPEPDVLAETQPILIDIPDTTMLANEERDDHLAKTEFSNFETKPVVTNPGTLQTKNKLTDISKATNKETESINSPNIEFQCSDLETELVEIPKPPVLTEALSTGNSEFETLSNDIPKTTTSKETETNVIPAILAKTQSSDMETSAEIIKALNSENIDEEESQNIEETHLIPSTERSETSSSPEINSEEAIIEMSQSSTPSINEDTIVKENTEEVNTNQGKDDKLSCESQTDSNLPIHPEEDTNIVLHPDISLEDCNTTSNDLTNEIVPKSSDNIKLFENTSVENPSLKKEESKNILKEVAQKENLVNIGIENQIQNDDFNKLEPIANVVKKEVTVIEEALKSPDLKATTRKISEDKVDKSSDSNTTPVKPEPSHVPYLNDTLDNDNNLRMLSVVACDYFQEKNVKTRSRFKVGGNRLGNEKNQKGKPKQKITGKLLQKQKKRGRKLKKQSEDTVENKRMTRSCTRTSKKPENPQPDSNSDNKKYFENTKVSEKKIPEVTNSNDESCDSCEGNLVIAEEGVVDKEVTITIPDEDPSEQLPILDQVEELSKQQIELLKRNKTNQPIPAPIPDVATAVSKSTMSSDISHGIDIILGYNGSPLETRQEVSVNDYVQPNEKSVRTKGQRKSFKNDTTLDVEPTLTKNAYPSPRASRFKSEEYKTENPAKSSSPRRNSAESTEYNKKVNTDELPYSVKNLLKGKMEKAIKIEKQETVTTPISELVDTKQNQISPLINLKTSKSPKKRWKEGYTSEEQQSEKEPKQNNCNVEMTKTTLLEINITSLPQPESIKEPESIISLDKPKIIKRKKSVHFDENTDKNEDKLKEVENNEVTVALATIPAVDERNNLDISIEVKKMDSTHNKLDSIPSSKNEKIKNVETKSSAKIKPDNKGKNKIIEKTNIEAKNKKQLAMELISTEIKLPNIKLTADIISTTTKSTEIKQIETETLNKNIAESGQDIEKDKKESKTNRSKESSSYKSEKDVKRKSDGRMKDQPKANIDDSSSSEKILTVPVKRLDKAEKPKSDESKSPKSQSNKSKLKGGRRSSRSSSRDSFIITENNSRDLKDSCRSDVDKKNKFDERISSRKSTKELLEVNDLTNIVSNPIEKEPKPNDDKKDKKPKDNIEKESTYKKASETKRSKNRTSHTREVSISDKSKCTEEVNIKVDNSRSAKKENLETRDYTKSKDEKDRVEDGKYNKKVESKEIRRLKLTEKSSSRSSSTDSSMSSERESKSKDKRPKSEKGSRSSSINSRSSRERSEQKSPRSSRSSTRYYSNSRESTTDRKSSDNSQTDRSSKNKNNVNKDEMHIVITRSRTKDVIRKSRERDYDASHASKRTEEKQDNKIKGTSKDSNDKSSKVKDKIETEKQSDQNKKRLIDETTTKHDIEVLKKRKDDTPTKLQNKGNSDKPQNLSNTVPSKDSKAKDNLPNIVSSKESKVSESLSNIVTSKESKVSESLSNIVSSKDSKGKDKSIAGGSKSKISCNEEKLQDDTLKLDTTKNISKNEESKKIKTEKQTTNVDSKNMNIEMETDKMDEKTVTENTRKLISRKEKGKEAKEEDIAANETDKMDEKTVTENTRKLITRKEKGKEAKEEHIAATAKTTSDGSLDSNCVDEHTLITKEKSDALTDLAVIQETSDVLTPKANSDVVTAPNIVTFPTEEEPTNLCKKVATICSSKAEVSYTVLEDVKSDPPILPEISKSIDSKDTSCNIDISVNISSDNLEIREHSKGNEIIPLKQAIEEDTSSNEMISKTEDPLIENKVPSSKSQEVDIEPNLSTTDNLQKEDSNITKTNNLIVAEVNLTETKDKETLIATQKKKLKLKPKDSEEFIGENKKKFLDVKKDRKVEVKPVSQHKEITELVKTTKQDPNFIGTKKKPQEQLKSTRTDIKREIQEQAKRLKEDSSISSSLICNEPKLQEEITSDEKGAAKLNNEVKIKTTKQDPNFIGTKKKPQEQLKSTRTDIKREIQEQAKHLKEDSSISSSLNEPKLQEEITSDEKGAAKLNNEVKMEVLHNKIETKTNENEDLQKTENSKDHNRQINDPSNIESTLEKASSDSSMPKIQAQINPSENERRNDDVTVELQKNKTPQKNENIETKPNAIGTSSNIKDEKIDSGLKSNENKETKLPDWVVQVGKRNATFREKSDHQTKRARKDSEMKKEQFNYKEKSSNFEEIINELKLRNKIFVEKQDGSNKDLGDNNDCNKKGTSDAEKIDLGDNNDGNKNSEKTTSVADKIDLGHNNEGNKKTTSVAIAEKIKVSPDFVGDKNELTEKKDIASANSNIEAVCDIATQNISDISALSDDISSDIIEEMVITDDNEIDMTQEIKSTDCEASVPEIIDSPVMETKKSESGCIGKFVILDVAHETPVKITKVPYDQTMKLQDEGMLDQRNRLEGINTPKQAVPQKKVVDNIVATTEPLTAIEKVPKVIAEPLAQFSEEGAHSRSLFASEIPRPHLMTPIMPQAFETLIQTDVVDKKKEESKQPQIGIENVIQTCSSGVHMVESHLLTTMSYVTDLNVGSDSDPQQSSKSNCNSLDVDEITLLEKAKALGSIEVTTGVSELTSVGGPFLCVEGNRESPHESALDGNVMYLFSEQLMENNLVPMGSGSLENTLVATTNDFFSEQDSQLNFDFMESNRPQDVCLSESETLYVCKSDTVSDKPTQNEFTNSESSTQLSDFSDNQGKDEVSHTLSIETMQELLSNTFSSSDNLTTNVSNVAQNESLNKKDLVEINVNDVVYHTTNVSNTVQYHQNETLTNTDLVGTGAAIYLDVNNKIPTINISNIAQHHLNETVMKEDFVGTKSDTGYTKSLTSNVSNVAHRLNESLSKKDFVGTKITDAAYTKNPTRNVSNIVQYDQNDTLTNKDLVGSVSDAMYQTVNNKNPTQHHQNETVTKKDVIGTDVSDAVYHAVDNILSLKTNNFPLTNCSLADMEAVTFSSDTWTQDDVMKMKTADAMTETIAKKTKEDVTSNISSDLLLDMKIKPSPKRQKLEDTSKDGSSKKKKQVVPLVPAYRVPVTHAPQSKPAEDLFVPRLPRTVVRAPTKTVDSTVKEAETISKSPTILNFINPMKSSKTIPKIIKEKSNSDNHQKASLTDDEEDLLPSCIRKRKMNSPLTETQKNELFDKVRQSDVSRVPMPNSSEARDFDKDGKTKKQKSMNELLEDKPLIPLRTPLTDMRRKRPVQALIDVDELSNNFKREAQNASRNVVREAKPEPSVQQKRTSVPDRDRVPEYPSTSRHTRRTAETIAKISAGRMVDGVIPIVGGKFNSPYLAKPSRSDVDGRSRHPRNDMEPTRRRDSYQDNRCRNHQQISSTRSDRPFYTPYLKPTGRNRYLTETPLSNIAISSSAAKANHDYLKRLDKIMPLPNVTFSPPRQQGHK